MVDDVMTDAPLHPTPSDEGPHAPEKIPLWNESWYFDFADRQQSFGGWIRLGLMPNEDTAWITALVCGPHMPTIAVLNFQAALPANPLRVQSDDTDPALTPMTPLREYRVAVRGSGKAYRDPSALLHGESSRGEDIDLSM